jgi:hypothetical protein
LSENEAKKDIREMAKLTLLNNRLSDVQVKNMKMFPLVYFDGILSARLDYDLSTRREVETEEDKVGMNAKYSVRVPSHSGSKVAYYLEIDEATPNTNLEKRFSALEDSIRGLFWNDVELSVYFNERLVFKSGTNV